MRGHADQGVILVRQPMRIGKTAAETAAAEYVAGETMFNSDAQSASPVTPVARFGDVRVGVAFSQDVA